MSLLLRINLWLCLVFALFLATALVIGRWALENDAREDATGDARLMMDSAQAARDYTSEEIAPLIAAREAASADPPFHPQTIPAYAATQVFDALRRQRPEFVYREAMLNPTNPRDRALVWEADIIERFRREPELKELANVRKSEFGASLYLARPIRIADPSCLGCHDTASVAPASVVRQYGTANGYGWKLNEVLGAQIVSVPMASAIAGANHALAIIAGMLTALFVLLFVVTNLIVRALVLRPIARLASAADSISSGRPVPFDLKVPGKDEIASLCRAFDRMKTSIEKSLVLLAQRE
jgi:HAMP domain-containing protein